MSRPAPSARFGQQETAASVVLMPQSWLPRHLVVVFVQGLLDLHRQMSVARHMQWFDNVPIRLKDG
jgi:hypothetical protein